MLSVSVRVRYPEGALDQHRFEKHGEAPRVARVDFRRAALEGRTLAASSGSIRTMSFAPSHPRPANPSR